MKKIYLLLIALTITSFGFGQINLTTGNTTYSNNFTGFLGTANPTGWTTSDVADTSTWNGTDGGASSTGAKYSYGTGSGASFEGSIGFLPSGSKSINADITFTNNTGNLITGFNISYVAEQWRRTNSGRINGWEVSYQINTGSFNAISSLNYSAVNSGSAILPIINPKSGNVVVNIPNGSSIKIRFFGDNGTGSGSRQGVAIDNFSVSFTEQIACTPPTTQATAYNTTGITTTTATPRWTIGTGDNVLVVMRQGGAVNQDPVNGTSYTSNPAFGSGQQIGTGNFVVYSGPTSNFANVTGLTQNMNYHVAVYQYATTGTCYNLTELTGNFNTLCTAVSSLPFTEDFEGGVVPPACWTTFRGTNNLGTAQDWGISAAGEGRPASGFAAKVNPINIAPSVSQDWLVTPALDLTLTSNNELTFWSKNNIVGDQLSTLSVRVSTTSQTNIATFSAPIQTFAEVGTTYMLRTVDLSAYDSNATVYVAFVMEQSDGDVWLLDDVEVSGDCVFPATQATGFSATAINADAGTATLNWTRGNGNNVLVVVKETSATLEDPTSGISYTANPIFGAGDEIGTGNFVVYNGPATNVNISNLLSDSNYNVAIYEYNNTAVCYNLTQLSGSFYVPCASVVLPFTEDFEGGAIPACWATFETNGFGNENWTVDGSQPNNGSNFSARMPFEFGTTPSGISENWLVTPAIDLSSALFGELTFFSRDGDDSDVYTSEYTVRVSTASQTTPGDFTILPDGTYDEITLGGTYNKKTFNLNAYAGQVIYIAFVMTQDVDAGGDDWYLDDVEVRVPVFPTKSFWVEPFTNNAQYNVPSGFGAEGIDGDSDYFTITNGSNINKTYIGANGNFFAAQDIDGNFAGSASPSRLEWTGINVSRYSSLKFSGKFASSAIDKIDSGDFVILEYQLDGGGWNNLIAFENDGATFNSFFQEDTNFDGTGDGTQLTNTFQTFSKSIPSTGAVLDLRITIAVDSGDEDIALEDFRLVGFGTGYEANDAVGFGGAVGLGTMEILAYQAPKIEFKFNRGVASPGPSDFNNYMVIYIDSKAGGIANTTGLTDNTDQGRRAISGFDGGSQRATLNFPPGFRPDYAIAMNFNFANLFEIVEGGSHISIGSANLNPPGSVNSSTYSFNIPFTDIMTSPSLEGFKFLATYIDGTNAFRSNESFGRNTAVGNPGIPSTMTFETYFQVSSGLQGGIAPTIATGAWSADSVWLNGNPPLSTDEITINQDVIQNINVTAIDGITINAALDVLETYTLTTAGGLTGPGTIDVSGKLSITEGGFTDISPVYNSGATLEYKDVLAVYNRFNEWTLGAAPSNVIIDNADLDMTNLSINPNGTEDFNIGNNLTILNNGSMTIAAVKSVTVGNAINNIGGTVSLGSNSTRYSSLIASSVTGGGTFNYKRHINGQPGVGVGTGANDLVSPPVSGQTFTSFVAANPNLRADLVNNPDRKLFGPFSKTSGTYVLWIDTVAQQANNILGAGVGYRTASTNNDGFTFTGSVNTGNISYNIENTGPQFMEYNLIGNPYPSYLNVRDFLEYEVASGVANIDLMQNPLRAIYGYDGDASGVGGSGWIIYNLNTAIDVNLAPGQGFLVTADAASVAAHDIVFNPLMRRTDATDDFIPGRSIETNLHLKLQAAIGTSNYKTDFYFNDNSTSGLDSGYDAGVFGSNATPKSIYSHLVQDNTGVDIAIQSLALSALGSDISIPLGINVPQGEQVTVSIDESNIPANIEVYLEDVVNGSFTLLNTADYVFTPTSNLTDTGRFFLRFNSNTLSTDTTDLDRLQIYTQKQTLFVNGLLNAATTVTLFDIQGRKVLTTGLESGSTNNTIDVSKMSTGVYIVKLNNATQQKTQRVIIK